jgi:hypothetical protein
MIMVMALSLPLIGTSSSYGEPVTARELDKTTHKDLEFFTYQIPDSEGEGFEPHIVAGPSIYGDEWLYIDSPTGIGGGQSGNLWISKDQGDSWEPHPYGRNALGSGDSYTAIAKDGTIYYTDLYLWSSTIDTSKDGGDTWIRNPLATVTRVGDRQWLNMGPTVGSFPGAQSETLYMTYNDIPQGLIIQKSSWTTRGFIWIMGNNRLPVTSSVGSRDHFCVDQMDGTIYLPNKDGGGIAVYVSTDGADSFTRHQVLQTDEDIQNIFIASDVDIEGNVYLAWSNQEHVFMGTSRDKGQAWAITQVTDTNGTRVLPWITVGDPGRVALTWYDTPDTNGSSDEKEEADWGTFAAITTDAFADNVSFIISPVEDYVHTGAIRTTGTGGDADRDLGDFFTCDVDSYGRLILTYGKDEDDGPNARGSVVMFARQVEGPFLKKDSGPVAIFENQTYELEVQVDGGRSYDLNGEGLVEYQWSWGDGINSTGIRADHKYEKAGSYEITLKVTNKAGMKNTVSGTVSVKKAEARKISMALILIPLGLIAAGAGAFIYWRRHRSSGAEVKKE